ncbi:MAG: hypothetical protein OES57_15415 [Acidimicrobiia bacterium]|nr:hypothetical protein [Acidimicrobiia bacterium]
MRPPDVLTLFDSLVAPVTTALETLDDRGASGDRPGQYALDLVADGELLGPLVDAGLGVLSEESGVIDGTGPYTVVVDPVDGSTNASLGLPWFALSLCAVDVDGPAAALVANLATGRCFRAVRGEGATDDGASMSTPASVPLGEAVVGISGLPSESLGWGQFRAHGAAALDLCSVAAGELHGFVDCLADAHGVWDYAAAVLICREIGVEVVDAHGRDLLVLDPAARRTPVAAPAPLLDDLLAARARVLGR